ncbi:MAG: hypothetical protein JNK66_14140 [Chitinophagales bacterium]|nr:hypothetical protein [Chitinophagales bacterium]
MILSKDLDELNARALLVAGKLKQLQAKLESQQAEMANLETLLEAERKKNIELSEKLKIVKLAQNISNPGSENEPAAEIKKKINEYIREIDSCIAILND